MTNTLNLLHGPIQLPAFLPDATRGVVRSVDSTDLEQCRIQALVMNTFHLMRHPGSSTVQALGKLHRMSGWRRPIVTDSGGFQAYSLIRQNPKYGRLSDKGLIFRPEGTNRKIQLTPEKTIQLQLSYGTDVVICLDDCTHVDDSDETQQASVQRTIDWAQRGQREFRRILDQQGIALTDRPKLFAVIQGGGSQALRRRCAEALLATGFDGFGFGGWPLDADGNLLSEILAYTRSLIPPEFPLHALGVGHPANVAACAGMGYSLFDSAMPTRDARHGRLYVFDPEKTTSRIDLAERWFSYIYLKDNKHIKSDSPISSVCDCLCCTRYSLGYLHHLFKINDTLCLRLATIHNLRFMCRLMERLRLESDGSHGP